MSESPQGEPVRMKLACRDREHFLAEFAPKMSSRIFVPLDEPPAAGAIIALHIRFQDGEVRVKGTAEVIRVVHSPRVGVQVRFTGLDADSIQFSLGVGRPTETGEFAAIPRLDAAAVPLPGDAFLAVALPPVERPSAPRLSAARADAVAGAGPADVTRPGVPPPRSSPSAFDVTKPRVPSPRASAPVPLPGAAGSSSAAADVTKPGVPSPRASAPVPPGSSSAAWEASKAGVPVPLPGATGSSSAAADVTKPGLSSPRNSAPVPLPGGTGSSSAAWEASKAGVPVPLSGAAGSSSAAADASKPGPSSPRTSAPVPLPGATGSSSAAWEASKVGVPVPLPGATGSSSAAVDASKPGLSSPRTSAPVPLPGAIGTSSAGFVASGVPPPRSSPSALAAHDVTKPGVPSPRPSAPVPLPGATASSSVGADATKPGLSSPRASAPPPRSSPSAPVDATKPGVPAPRPSGPSAPALARPSAPPGSSQRKPEARASAPRPVAPFDSDHDVTSVVNVVVPAAAIPPERTRHGPPVDVEAPRPPEPAPRALDIPAGWDEAATSDSTTAAPRAGPARASGPDDFQPLRTSRRPLVAGVVVLLLVAVAGGGFVVLGGSNRSSPTASRKASQADSALSASLARIDERMMAGAYTGPGGDSALDHLRAAVQAAPGDARVKERQQRLAALFEQRAGEALARDDQAEAAVQFTALLLADPSRSGVKEKLAAAEAQVKNQAKAP